MGWFRGATKILAKGTAVETAGRRRSRDEYNKHNYTTALAVARVRLVGLTKVKKEEPFFSPFNRTRLVTNNIV